MMKGNNNVNSRRRKVRLWMMLAVALIGSTVWGTATYSGPGLASTLTVQSEALRSPSFQHNLTAAVVQEDQTASEPEITRTVLANTTSAKEAEGISPAAITAVAKADAKAAKGQASLQKTVYITFDDGPSGITREVLDILRREDVKATFFVLGNAAKSHPELIQAIWDQGHAIGNHSYNHDYHDLYSGFTAFWNQIKQTENIVRDITGNRPKLVRAPGGTFGHFDDTYFQLLKQAGYVVMDWTVDSGDSRRKGVPAADILRESTKDLKSREVILLLHDGGGHRESAKALPEIIARYKSAGYTFGILDDRVKPFQFRVSAKAAALQRTQPSAAWIASNIAPNVALFQPGRKLALEVGMMEAQLSPGEYHIENEQYMVPLRAVVERLGGQVRWDADSRTGKVVWNGRALTADITGDSLIYTSPGGMEAKRPAKVEMIGGSIWVPLRDLLELAGHPLKMVSSGTDERRVKAA